MYVIRFSDYIYYYVPIINQINRFRFTAIMNARGKYYCTSARYNALLLLRFTVVYPCLILQYYVLLLR